MSVCVLVCVWVSLCVCVCLDVSCCALLRKREKSREETRERGKERESACARERNRERERERERERDREREKERRATPQLLYVAACCSVWQCVVGFLLSRLVVSRGAHTVGRACCSALPCVVVRCLRRRGFASLSSVAQCALGFIIVFSFFFSTRKGFRSAGGCTGVLLGFPSPSMCSFSSFFLALSITPPFPAFCAAATIVSRVCAWSFLRFPLSFSSFSCCIV